MYCLVLHFIYCPILASGSSKNRIHQHIGWALSDDFSLSGVTGINTDVSPKIPEA